MPLTAVGPSPWAKHDASGGAATVPQAHRQHHSYERSKAHGGHKWSEERRERSPLDRGVERHASRGALCGPTHASVREVAYERPGARPGTAGRAGAELAAPPSAGARRSQRSPLFSFRATCTAG